MYSLFAICTVSLVSCASYVCHLYSNSVVCSFSVVYTVSVSSVLSFCRRHSLSVVCTVSRCHLCSLSVICTVSLSSVQSFACTVYLLRCFERHLCLCTVCCGLCARRLSMIQKLALGLSSTVWHCLMPTLVHWIYVGRCDKFSRFAVSCSYDSCGVLVCRLLRRLQSRFCLWLLVMCDVCL